MKSKDFMDKDVFALDEKIGKIKDSSCEIEYRSLGRVFFVACVTLLS